jgi:hypothetical protein
MKKFTQFVTATERYLSESVIGQATPMDTPPLAQLGDNAPILAGQMDTEPVTRYMVVPSCSSYACPPIPPNYNPAASTQYFQWVQTWNTLMFNWNNPEWVTNRVAVYNILRDQYLQAFAPGIDPDKVWPPYTNLGI